MQSFETLFKRAWERSRDPRLRGWIVFNWLLLVVLAGVFAAATFGAYFVLIEKRQAQQSVVEVNPELRRIFGPRREIDLGSAKLSFEGRSGDKLRKVTIRTPAQEYRAKSAELRVNPEKGVVNLALRSYRIHEIVDGATNEKPTRQDNWGTWELSYQFRLPPGLKPPAKPVPGDIANSLVTITAIALSGAALWFWVWQILATGVSCEAAAAGPVRVLRGLGSGFARWRIVTYPVPLLTLCAVVGFVGALPNVLQLPIPFYLAIYPLAWTLQITLLMLTGIMMVGVAANPPETSFGDLVRESVKVFLNAWGRYLLGILWFYAFLAVFAVMLAPVLMPLINAFVFKNRMALSVSAVWLTVWLALLVVTGVRVRGCLAAYCMYLYLDASGRDLPSAAGGDSASPKQEGGEK